VFSGITLPQYLQRTVGMGRIYRTRDLGGAIGINTGTAAGTTRRFGPFLESANASRPRPSARRSIPMTSQKINGLNGYVMTVGVGMLRIALTVCTVGPLVPVTTIV